MNGWQKVRNIDPQSLTETRIQLHYAIQFMAAVGNFLIEPQPDYSHASLTWNSELKVFVSSLVTAEQPFYVALEPISLTSLVLDAQGNQLAEFSLPQKNLNDGMNWLKQTIEPLGADLAKLNFVTYPDDFPDSAIARGATFNSNDEAKRQELTAYFANTNSILQAVSTRTEGTSSVHIWPHHFDIAMLISLPYTKKDEAVSIGVGMSPGDGSYDRPYWYVTPWPYPDPTSLTQLAGGGIWHTEGWVGAILTASQLSQGEEQQAQVEAFLDSAIEASLELLK
ncbi:hypothetical protein [Kamptonema sp. UHCC 0994]|uniref:hypothetical protein n=1 Tax=Kamptonema sp. UHCC 0994 TaxID=3031329 RepID=UPI0023B88EA0|nr:hypothetical protein [Kamptonema sp. UHCC 0994]MDF0555305.1 hypothetical protein [Kamptonema sp. UHCC 0994]